MAFWGIFTTANVDPFMVVGTTASNVHPIIPLVLNRCVI